MTVTETKRTDSAVQERSLGEYVSRISGDSDVYRTVSRQVNPAQFDVTAVLERLDQQRRFEAVHFLNPLGLDGEPSRFSVIANLFSTRPRIAEMLHLDSRDVGPELGLQYGELVAERRAPEVVPGADAPVQQNVLRGEDATMNILPAVTHSEMDLGAVLTMAHVMKGPDDDFYNVTFAKTFPSADGRRGGITIHTPDLSRLLREWEARGRRFPVVNVLGHHPGFWLGSLAVTPYGTNEYETIGGFLGHPLRLTPSVTWGDEFLVPADAEIIIEAEMIPGERTIVNPFGEISRQYQAQEFAPVMEVTAITYRDGAVMQDVFSGHREHMLLGSIPREGSLQRHLQGASGNVKAVHLPYSGAGRFVCYISIKKAYEGHPKEVAIQALARVPALQTIIIVDEDIDAFNEEDVMWAVHVYADPDRDIDVLHNLKQPTDYRALGGSRMIIDATRPTDRAFPTKLRVPPDAVAAVELDEWLDPAERG
jgi:UbiD family decarboxylase